MNRTSFMLILLASCQASPPAPLTPRALPGIRWVLVERPYDEVESWIQDSGDAELAGDETTLVFEPVEAERDERLELLLQASRCPHRLRCSGDIPGRPQVGEPVEVTLSIDCDPRDVHRVDVIPTRPGVRILGFQGTLDERPNLSGFYVRGSARVSVRFTADSQGPGGIKAILSEFGREGVPRLPTK
jgi:hypothetical protein